MAKKEIETTVEVIDDFIVSDGGIDTTDLIEVAQLPIIVERLNMIREQVEKRVHSAVALECTEESKQAVKEERKELNKMFNALEEKRKEVKNSVLKPYNDFETLYKQCVTDVFKPADEKLRKKIATVENAQKEQKRLKVLAFFEEYAESLGIDFVRLDDVGLNITLNVSEKKLKEECKAFLDRIKEGLDLIAFEDHQDEILVEFKDSFNAASAITIVKNRYKRIEEARLLREEEEARKKAEAERQKEIDEVIAEEQLNAASSDLNSEIKAFSELSEAFSAPVAEDISVPEEAEQEVFEALTPTHETVDEVSETISVESETQPRVKRYKVAFEVIGTADDMKAMKELFKERGMKYVKL